MPTLVVEDGSGLASANSLLSLAEADTLADSSLDGDDWSLADDEVKQRALITASRLVNDGFDWFGRKRSAVQAFEWPRTGMIDRSGFAISSSTIPGEIKRAVADLARTRVTQAESGSTGGASPAIASVTVGQLAVRFVEGEAAATTTTAPTGTIRDVSVALRHLGVPVGPGARMGRLVR